MLSEKIQKILLEVQKPGRYVGGELNSVIKNKDDVAVRYAFCFPDTYEIGMSHLGMKILYSVVNNRDDAWCERVFAPDNDMEEKMRENNVPLWALESGDSVKDFDLIGFTLQYELSFSNVLNMLDLAGVPIYSKDRPDLTPIVVAGGPCACNAEPMADFIDVFMLGDGEETTDLLISLVKKHKELGSSKLDFLRDVATHKGFYVPAFYDVEYNADGTIRSVTANQTAPEKAEKAIVSDMDKAVYPEKFIVPSIEVVHDRVTAEIFRGCIRGCRFCQAGFLYRPIREKSPEVVEAQCKKLCETSGYDEISLCSLSTSDYTGLQPLLNSMLDWTTKEKINVALPSLRVDNFSEELMEKLAVVRRSSLTFAPEAGTQRLRDAINKNVTEADVMSTVDKAFAGGWTAVKLYFMIGLPTETLDDVAGIAQLGQKVVDEFYRLPDRPKGKGVQVSISASSFVPKPFTPFQWEPQDTQEMLAEKQQHLMDSVTTKKIKISTHTTQTSFMEGVLARGDRRLSKVIELAWKKGCKFDSWDDQFKYDMWMEAFEEVGLDPSFYANRRRDFEEILPWDHLDYGISKAFLINENKKAHESITTPHCRIKCAGCGSNKLNGGKCDALSKA
ncbi:MAG: TIGR03960 family B12-binding radical SAM protein [Acutalibacteraceae bacterium]|nr:TIGR03960 family B12-binding radical SAM protein [Acutalibacteraceae bacterium]